MSSDDPLAKPDVDVATPAEAKRRAARRRFLGRSAAVGSGLGITTLFHTRAFGQNLNLVSSIEACTSFPGAQVEYENGFPKLYQNSVTPEVFNRYNCIKPG